MIFFLNPLRKTLKGAICKEKLILESGKTEETLIENTWKYSTTTFVLKLGKYNFFDLAYHSEVSSDRTI